MAEHGMVQVKRHSCYKVRYIYQDIFIIYYKLIFEYGLHLPNSISKHRYGYIWLYIVVVLGLPTLQTDALKLKHYSLRVGILQLRHTFPILFRHSGLFLGILTPGYGFQGSL